MKARIEILHIEERKGFSFKTGKAYEMTVCQCVVHGDKKLVGELVLPKDHPKLQPGLFDATFGIAVSSDKRIGGQVLQLTPVVANSGFDKVNAAKVA